MLTEKRVRAAWQPYGIYQSSHSVLFQNAVCKFVQFTRVLHKLPLRVVQLAFSGMAGVLQRGLLGEAQPQNRDQEWTSHGQGDGLTAGCALFYYCAQCACVQCRSSWVDRPTMGIRSCIFPRNSRESLNCNFRNMQYRML